MGIETVGASQWIMVIISLVTTAVGVYNNFLIARVRLEIEKAKTEALGEAKKDRHDLRNWINEEFIRMDTRIRSVEIRLGEHIGGHREHISTGD